jgi:hypothetical protein
VDVDDADVERSVLEGGPFQHFDHRPDRVVLAQVVVQPQLVQSFIAIPMEQVDAGALVRATSARRPSTKERRSSTRTTLVLLASTRR